MRVLHVERVAQGWGHVHDRKSSHSERSKKLEAGCDLEVPHSDKLGPIANDTFDGIVALSIIHYHRFETQSQIRSTRRSADKHPVD